MRGGIRCAARAALGLMILAVGCAKPTAPTDASDDAAVRATFVALQMALKDQDAVKVWELLDADSQADAERQAQMIQTAYGKASAPEKAEQAKALGLAGTELSTLTGKGFLKTKRFLGKWDEIPDSKIDKVVVQGDKALVIYIEADGDVEKLTLVRQGGPWKVALPMPK